MFIITLLKTDAYYNYLNSNILKILLIAHSKLDLISSINEENSVLNNIITEEDRRLSQYRNWLQYKIMLNQIKVETVIF